MFVVTGATGNTGSVVAKTLLERGKEVTVVLRDQDKAPEWKSRGAKVAIADLGDSVALANALRDAEGAYILVPPLYGAPDFLAAMAKLSDAIAQGVRDSGINHIVMLSSIGAQHPEGTGPIRNLYYAERVILPAAKDSTVLRASYFIENWLAVLGAVQKDGVLPSFFPADFKMPMNATADIGRVAAELLLDPANGRRIVELEGPEPYSPADVAKAFESVFHKPVKVLELPLEAAVPSLMQAGFSEPIAKLFAEMYAGVLNGHVARDGQGKRHFGKITPDEVFAGAAISAAT